MPTTDSKPSSEMEPRTLVKGEHRLFEPLFGFAAMAEAIFTATLAVKVRHVNAGNELKYEAKYCNASVSIPQRTIIPIIESGIWPTSITYRFGPPRPILPTSTIANPLVVKLGERSDTTFSIDFSSLTGRMLDLFYTSLIETNFPWVLSNCSGDPYLWPPILNFARVIRNSVAHHKGKINFENPRAGAVKWRGLSYSPADNGRQAIGGDMDLGDLIILMFEISDELDRLGCPVNG